MIREKVIVIDKIGFHARTASLFAKNASTFTSDIKIAFKEKEVNAKSMLKIMTLGVKCNDTIEIIAEGEDEQKAMETMTSLVKINFNI